MSRRESMHRQKAYAGSIIVFLASDAEVNGGQLMV